VSENGEGQKKGNSVWIKRTKRHQACIQRGNKSNASRTHMEDMRDNTNRAIYEQFRFERLVRTESAEEQQSESNIFFKVEQERREYEKRLARMESEKWVRNERWMRKG
jgi:hypothetical protein